MKKIALLLALVLTVSCFALVPAAKADGDTLVVYNWYDYIDESVIDMFEEETGIKVKYVNFTTCEEMYVKMTQGGSLFDVCVPSDYIIERFIQEDMLAPIDYSKLQYTNDLLPWLWECDYDMGNKFSVPYMWGTVGILFNTDYVDGEITSWSSLYDPSYQNDVLLLDSIRDTMGTTLKYLGYSLNCREEDALAEVTALLIKQKEDGIVQGYMVDEVKDKMVAGEAAMAVMWSGDAMYSIEENDSLVYVVPEEGSNVWVDALCIPKTTQNYEGALKFIDFMCRPDIAQMNYDYIHYASPIRTVVDNLPEDEAANPAVNPTDEMISRCEFFHDIMDYMDVYNKYWMQVRA